MATIELTNCGPVSHVSIPVPEDGGLVVLRARNGAGKTKTLEAVDAALTGRGKLDVRDGALNGRLEAFGVTLTVGRSTRRTGELVVESLEGKLSISDLIDPGLKSADAADARRIKALVQLSGAKPDPGLFYDLTGGRESLEQHASASALTSDDLVLMAERIKRDLEAAARKEESQAEHAEGRSLGAKEAADGVDLTAQCDHVQLQAALEAAIRQESQLRSESVAARKAQQAAAQARAQLEDAEAGYCGDSLADSQAAEQRCQEQAQSSEQAVRSAEELLRKARQDHETARNALSAAIAARKAAESHEQMVNQWRKQIAQSVPAGPTVQQLAQAAERIEEARAAAERGVLIRRAREHLAESKQHLADAKQHRQQANRLRESAKGTDEVLSGVVGQINRQLRVEGGRLVLTTRRGATYFHDLSAGERSRIAVDIGIDAVGARGVLTLSQEIFEGLDPVNREELARHAKDRGVVILTAEASDDEEIVAEIFGGVE